MKINNNLGTTVRELEFSFLKETDLGVTHNSLHREDVFKYDNKRLKFRNPGHNDNMEKSCIILKGSYFKDGDFFVGRLKDYPEIFTDDYDLEGLKNRLKESFSLFFNIKIDHINIKVEIDEDSSLIETYPR